MKKLSKKQQLIILISIITIIVIIGIIIGANIIRTNIANGNYNSSNGSSNNNNLIPEYIKAGITLGGVTGTLEDLDTSDATATAEDIALGKTAYVNGIKITGTYEEKVPDLTSTNTTFTPNINYWTNQNVTVNVSTTISGYTLQLATADPNVESNWHNATSQEMTANGTVYARLTNGSKSGGYTSYEVWNIDKTPIESADRIVIGRTQGLYLLQITVAGIRDTESGIAKVIIYYKSEINSTYYSKEINLATINGVDKGESGYNYQGNSLENRFQLTQEESEGYTLYGYWEAYDVAGNKCTSYLASVTPDGQTSYTPQ